MSRQLSLPKPRCQTENSSLLPAKCSLDCWTCTWPEHAVEDGLMLLLESKHIFQNLLLNLNVSLNLALGNIDIPREQNSLFHSNILVNFLSPLWLVYKVPNTFSSGSSPWFVYLYMISPIRSWTNAVPIENRFIILLILEKCNTTVF